MTVATPILTVEDLSVHFPAGEGRRAGTIRAVDGVSLEVPRGSTLGIVGESGCGKSTLGFSIVMLERPTSGRVLLDGVDIGALGRSAMRRARRKVQIVFQDSAASLNPRMPIGDLIGEVLDIHGLSRGTERSKRIRQLLDLVGLPASFATRFPHELSGGQAQRVAICRALAVQPDLIVCDEPVSALDVSIQAQIINLLREIQKDIGLSYIFISHDLGVVRHISDHVAVMYLGKIVEYAPKEELYARPSHPYTKALLSAIPIPDPAVERARSRIILRGDLPSPTNPPSGCVFRTRCPMAIDACAGVQPAPREVGPKHWAACIRLS